MANPSQVDGADSLLMSDCRDMPGTGLHLRKNCRNHRDAHPAPNSCADQVFIHRQGLHGVSVQRWYESARFGAVRTASACGRNAQRRGAWDLLAALVLRGMNPSLLSHFCIWHGQSSTPSGACLATLSRGTHGTRACSFWVWLRACWRLSPHGAKLIGRRITGNSKIEVDFLGGRDRDGILPRLSTSRSTRCSYANCS